MTTTRRKSFRKSPIDAMIDSHAGERGRTTGRLLTLPNVGNKLMLYLGHPVKVTRIKGARSVEGYIQNDYTFDLPSNWNLVQPPRLDEKRGITIHAEQVGTDRVVAIRNGGLFEMSEVYG